MAAKVAIAIRQAEALERVETAAATLSARFELAPVELAPQQRDADMARALQLEAVAGLLEEIVAKVVQPVSPKVAPPARQRSA